MIRAVIFDFFGVLTTDGTRELKDSHPDPAVRQEIAEITRANDPGELSNEAFSTRMAKVVGQTEPEIYKLFYGNPRLDQKLLRIINQVRQTHKVGLLSNASQASIGTYWSPDELTAHFDALVLSADVHLVKPDPAIYQMTCDRLGVLPQEALFIDDVEYFVQAAREVGMQGIVFTGTPPLEANLIALGLLPKS